MRRLRVLLLGLGAVLTLSAQTRVDYPVQVRNGPLLSDATPASGVLSTLCASASQVTLAVTKQWNTLSSQTLACQMEFTSGRIQAGASQTITLTQFPACPPTAFCFDTTKGGKGSIRYSGPVGGTVTPQNFGAVCNGITDSTNPNYHDDLLALQSAAEFFPPDRYQGSTNPQGVKLLAGAVVIPVTSDINSTASSCVISDTLAWPPSVKLVGAATGTVSVIETKDGFAPLTSGRTVASITNITGGGGSKIHITATNNYVAGDSVVIQEVDSATDGCYQINSWGGVADVVAGWVVDSTNLSSAGFDLASSTGAPACTYVSGGTVWNGVEKPILTIVDTLGTGNDPVNNFNVQIENIVLEAGPNNNQMVSGLQCFCSVGSRIAGVTIQAKYRLLSAANGLDNVTFDRLTLNTQTTSTGGPDTQAIVLVAGDFTRVHSVIFGNLKVTGGAVGNLIMSASTPAISLIGAPGGVQFNAPNFEVVPWPIALQVTSATGVHFNAVSAMTDDQSAPCASALSTYPQVAMLYSAVGNQIQGTDVRINGVFNCYANGVTSVGGVPILNQRAPASTADISPYPMNYDSNYPLAMLSSYIPGANEASGIATVISGTGSDGKLTRPGIYVGVGYTFFHRGDSAASGYDCWATFQGSAGANTAPEYDIFSYDTCAHLVTGAAANHQFLRIGNGSLGNCYTSLGSTGFNICLDPAGAEGVGTGGNFGVVGTSLLQGRVAIGTNEQNILLYSAAGTALPTCNSGAKGVRAMVSDATGPTFLGTYSSGGAVVSPVMCNGTNWVTY